MTHPQTHDDEALVRDAAKAINRLLSVRQRWWVAGFALLACAPIAQLFDLLTTVPMLIVLAVGCLFKVAEADRGLDKNRAVIAYFCDRAALTALRNHEGRK